MLKEFTIKTDKEGIYDITSEVAGVINESKVKEGIVMVYCPHTTASITINENADADVKHDLLLGLRCSYPDNKEFRHNEGNSACHLKSSAFGASETLIVKDGEMILGRWQSIFFCEFDGPRERKYYVKVV